MGKDDEYQKAKSRHPSQSVENELEHQLQNQIQDCSAQCHDKTHHEDEVSAREHVRELGGSAYYYDCECELEGQHFHVASSSVPRRWR
jgi:hypothetical protein